MSDTKALYDVVGKALANWGNGEAQDALETLMGRLRDVEKEREEDQGVIRVWRGRCGRAEADNAALLAALGSARDALGEAQPNIGWGTPPRLACGRAYDAAGVTIDQPHPGAALLEEVEGLREENARLSEERNHWERRAGLTVADVVREVAREPIAIRVDGIPETMRAIIKMDAHNAALEEAAKVAQSEFDHGDESDRVRDYFANVVTAIRALKKTGQGE